VLPNVCLEQPMTIRTSVNYFRRRQPLASDLLAKVV
jgi:hypothetical protein